MESIAAYQALLRNRNDKPKTVAQYGRILRKVARDLGGPIWTPGAYEQRGSERTLAGTRSKTRRVEQIVVRQFTEFLCDPRYSWGARYKEAYGRYPIQPIYDANEIINAEDLESRSDGVRPVTFAEARIFFQHLDDVARNASSMRERRQALRDGSLFKFLHATGARCMEGATVRISDCAPVGDGSHFGNFGQIRVRGKAKAHGDERTRTVYATGYFPWLGKVLDNHVRNIMPLFPRGDENSMFVNENGAPLEASYVSSRFCKIRDDAGLPRGCSAHGLRRLFATTLALAGVDLWFVKDILGHEHIATTQGYLHIPQDHVTRLVKQHQTSILHP